jgi:hypothetical protein
MKLTYLMIKIIIFCVLIGIFTKCYMYYDQKSFQDALYISTSFQTFTGTNLVELSDAGKKIATTQLVFSYIFVTIIIYNIIS